MRKSQYFRKRKYQRLRQKKIYQKKQFLLGVFSFIILLTLFALIFLSPFFKIKKIEVKAKEEKFQKEIEVFAQRYLGQNFFLLSSQISKTILEKFPIISQCMIKKIFPDKLIIKIKKREPLALFCQIENEETETCFFLDKEGIVFKKALANQNNSLLKIKKTVKSSSAYLGEKVLQEEKLSRFLEIEKFFQNNLKISLESLHLENEEKMTAKTEQGWEVYFHLQKDLKKQLRNLNLLLERKIPFKKRKDLEYIDLRFGNRVYYKLQRSKTRR